MLKKNRKLFQILISLLIWLRVLSFKKKKKKNINLWQGLEIKGDKSKILGFFYHPGNKMATSFRRLGCNRMSLRGLNSMMRLELEISKAQNH